MLPGGLGREAVRHGGGPDAPDLVGGDAHANAGAADQDPQVGVPVHHRISHLFGILGVMAGVGVMGPQVQDFVPRLYQMLFDDLLEGVSAVIGAHCDSHCCSNRSFLIRSAWESRR